MQLKDVKAIVTGAARGMGAHFARRLSDETAIPATFHRMDIYDWFEEA